MAEKSLVWEAGGHGKEVGDLIPELGNVLIGYVDHDPGLSPALEAAGWGGSGAVAAEKFDFERVTSSSDEVMQDPDVATVLVLTRHDSHAALAERALQAGKHVFVEKPLVPLRKRHSRLWRLPLAPAGVC
jgi:predicted dehydrogenase